MQKKPKQRRNRNRKSRTQAGSSSSNVYPMHKSSPQEGTHFNMQFQQISPTFANSIPSSPFFNIANGAVTGPTEMPGSEAGPILDPYLDADLDGYVGGTPMSPTANSLLPSNLFAFEDAPPSLRRSPTEDDTEIRRMRFDALKGFVVPQSPMSSESVSTSPRSSFNHIPLFSNLPPGARDSHHHLESSERGTTMSPIGSNRLSAVGDGESAAPKSNSRRFVNLFSNSFSRQRGKTVGFDGGPPMLGQTQPTESHSLPKNDPPGLDPIGTRRSSGSHGSWSTSLDFLHGRTKALGRTNSDHSRRSATFNQFNPSFDPIDPNRLFDRPASPRPSSIASFDNPLPAPSSDASAAFGWPSADLINHSHGNRPMGGNYWADFHTGRVSSSRPVSCPISPNSASGSTSSLSHLPSQSFFASPTNGRPVTPRLNPAAPTFQSLMGTPTRPPGSDSPHRGPDSISVNTDISGASGASLEHVATKESILSRFSSLSRKGSTSKFNISWGRGKKKDALDEELTEEVASAASSSKGSLWSAWKKEGENESEDEEGKGRLTPLAKESSPWLKGSQSGFFGAIGRTSKKAESVVEDEKEREKEKGRGREKGKGTRHI